MKKSIYLLIPALFSQVLSCNEKADEIITPEPTTTIVEEEQESRINDDGTLNANVVCTGSRCKTKLEGSREDYKFLGINQVLEEEYKSEWNYYYYKEIYIDDSSSASELYDLVFDLIDYFFSSETYSGDRNDYNGGLTFEIQYAFIGKEKQRGFSFGFHTTKTLAFTYGDVYIQKNNIAYDVPLLDEDDVSDEIKEKMASTIELTTELLKDMPKKHYIF